MSKVYVLYEHPTNNEIEISMLIGLVTRSDVATKFLGCETKLKDTINCYTFLELDDPELLNRIAKEGNNANKT